MDTTETLADRVVELERRQTRIIPASTGTDGWSNHLETRLYQERDYTDALLTEIIARLREEFSEIVAEAHTKHVRGTYDPTATYKSFDIVACNGASFIARRDDPTDCPGADWQMIAAQGKRGIAGPKGDPAPRISGWKVDRRQYTVTPIMSDGSFAPALELRSLFQQFNEETSG
jgi:hypothetical protein